MKLCFSTLGCAEYPLGDILSLCEKFDIRLLELRGIGGELSFAKMPELADEYIGITKSKFKSAGVSPLILGTSCCFHTEELMQRSLTEAKAALGYAHKLGANGIRVFGDSLTDEPKRAASRIIDGISELCGLSQNVDILLEVHGDFNTVPSLSPIIKALQNEKYFGIIWDIEHTHAAYGENWTEFYTSVAPFIRHVHIKDTSKSGLMLPGDGDIPIKAIVDRMLSDGYTGAFSLEWEKKWHPELPPLEDALEKFVFVMKGQP